MKEIKQSQKGNEYAVACDLKKGPQRITRAVLIKIPHNSNKKDISLKLGRYKTFTNVVDVDKPKSELTLDNEELDNLINYIQGFYEPLKLGTGKWLEIKDEDTLSIYKQIRSLELSDETIANELLESGLFTDNLDIAIQSIKKNKSLQEFKTNLEKDLPESFWQNWFSNNKWMLGSEYVSIINERDIDTENIADYLMEAFDGFVDIVEIKKPYSGAFWMTALDHGNYVPSSDLIKAITQCQNYLFKIEQESNSVKFLEKTKGVKIIKPRCLLVFGRSDGWNKEQSEAYRILNASYNQINILTYDHIYNRASQLLGIEDEVGFDDDLPF